MPFYCWNNSLTGWRGSSGIFVLLIAQNAWPPCRIKCSSDVQANYWSTVLLLSSFPGFKIGTMLDFFHCFGKQPSLRHLVRKQGKLLKTCGIILLVSPSSPGAFLGLNFFYRRFYFFLREGFVIFCVYQFLYQLSNLLEDYIVICLVFRNKIV